MNDRPPTRFEHIPLRAGEITGYQFTRSAIDRKDASHFLEFFDITRISSVERLHALFGAVRFTFDGFEDDQRALHEIPEVRSFVRDLAAQWPYFFYADELHNDFLHLLIYCLTEKVVLIDREDDPNNYGILLSPADANRACKPLFDGLVHVSGMDTLLNQKLFDARVEAIHKHIRKRVK